jgi:hypothetical protein
MIKRVKCWCLVGFFGLYTHCVTLSIDEKGIESAAGKTVQDIK